MKSSTAERGRAPEAIIAPRMQGGPSSKESPINQRDADNAWRARPPRRHRNPGTGTWIPAKPKQHDNHAPTRCRRPDDWYLYEQTGV
jgi:hypothetical protein